VLSLAKATPVLVPTPRAPDLELDQNATYILAGDLGALGLDIATWMATHGVKKLIFLSRSGGLKNKAELDHLRDTHSLTAEVYSCNITDASSVSNVFTTLRQNGHTIRGVVNLAMVLQDAIFANMTHTQWVTAISPKTLGSRNLAANLIPEEEPFFILLSSITGVIGNTAQANYAAGNTFEDALAHHACTHLGINATSIDVGLVADSSHFTAKGEFGDLESYLGRYGHGWKGLTIDLGELGVVMRAAMRLSHTVPAQVVLGLGDGIEHLEGGYTRDRKFVLRVRSIAADAVLGEDGQVKKDVTALLSSATTMTEAVQFVEDDIKALVAKAMGVEIAEVDAGKPLFDYGGKLSHWFCCEYLLIML
jgi:short-subunit dehydrogenase